jgi:hypothetical protein
VRLDTSADRVGHAAHVGDDRWSSRLGRLRPRRRASRGGARGNGEEAGQQHGGDGQRICPEARGGAAAAKPTLVAQEALSLPTAYGVSCRARAEETRYDRESTLPSGMRSGRFAPADLRSTPVRAVPPFPTGACSLPVRIRLAYVKRGSINMGTGAKLHAQVWSTTHRGGLLRRLSLPAGPAARRRMPDHLFP